MTDIAIRVENLSKLYRIGVERHDTLRDAAANFLPRIARIGTKGKDKIREIRDNSWQKESEFWALRDVSFEVRRGEVVGVIGRNGAGKSTLLKILSRITEPTSGHAEIHGRVGSLLEVGTGFHPELTGRENIYLNGAILGMKRTEIARKFDEIVAFSEIEKFLDTPVKRYSSGMYVRLAFAVAAHLEPEILLVDEVLAVGDAAFQKKCLGKMGDIAGEGRTVLFVSHNMIAIRQLCQRVVLLNSGTTQAIGPVDDIISRYLRPWNSDNGSIMFGEDIPNRCGFINLSLENEFGEIKDRFFVGDTLVIRARVKCKKDCGGLQASFIVKSAFGVGIYHCMTKDAGGVISANSEIIDIVAKLEFLKLYPGQYWIDDLWLADESGRTLDLKRECLGFQVIEGGGVVKRRLPIHAAMIYELPDWTVEYH